MASVMLWATTILAAVLVFISGHIAITVVLPKLRDFISVVVKDEKALSSLMTLLIVLVIVLALSSVISVLGALQNEAVSLLNVFNPGLNLLISLGKYIGYLVLGFMVVLGLKYYK